MLMIACLIPVRMMETVQMESMSTFCACVPGYTGADCETGKLLPTVLRDASLLVCG